MKLKAAATLELFVICCITSHCLHFIFCILDAVAFGALILETLPRRANSSLP